MTEGCIIENMSGRKLTYVVSGLLVMQILCFLLGAIVSPTPNSSMQVENINQIIIFKGILVTSHIFKKVYNPYSNSVINLNFQVLNQKCYDKDEGKSKDKWFSLRDPTLSVSHCETKSGIALVVINQI